MSDDVRVHVDNGLRHLTAGHRTETERVRDNQLAQFHSLQAKLDGLLQKQNVMQADATRQACLQVRALLGQERDIYISEHWGPLFLEKARPILAQMAILEQELAIAGKAVSRQ